MSRARQLLERLFGKKIMLHTGINGPSFPALISRNIIPGERQFRLTWFSKGGEPLGHVDVSQQEVDVILQGHLPPRVRRETRNDFYEPTRVEVKR